MTHYKGILAEIREEIGEEAYFKALEDLRQYIIWSKVRAYRERMNESTDRPYGAMEAIARKYPFMLGHLDRLRMASENVYHHDRMAGAYLDGEGKTYLKWCLKSFGARW